MNKIKQYGWQCWCKGFLVGSVATLVVWAATYTMLSYLSLISHR
jgi:hypothetical protein